MEPHELPGNDTPEKCKILFAGGCHLDHTTPEGFTTLSTVAMRVLAECGVLCEPEYLIQVRLAHFRRVERKCLECKPDVLVLQAGHPETTGLIGSYFVRRFGLTRYREQVVESTSSAPLPFHSLPHRLKWRARAACKALAHHASGHRLMDVEDFNLKLLTFLARVEAAGVPRVVVLSPLPCADPVPMYYRKVIAPVIRDAATQFGFEYLDLIRLDHPRWHTDPTHLNQTGHQVLGETLGRFLFCLLARRSAPHTGPDRPAACSAKRFAGAAVLAPSAGAV